MEVRTLVPPALLAPPKPYRSAGTSPWRGVALPAALLGALLLPGAPRAARASASADEASATAPIDAAVVRSLAEKGRYAEAETAARRLLAEAEAVRGAESREAAEALDLLVRTLVRARKGGVPETLELARRAVALNEALHGPESLEVASSLGNLAMVQRSQGKHPEAESSATRSVAIREARLGPDDPDVARALGARARVRIDAGKLPEAQVDLDRALGIFDRSQVPDFPDRSDALNSLGVLLATRGDSNGAIEAFRKVLEIRAGALGPDHPEVVAITNNLGVMLMTNGRYAEARPLFEHALAVDEARSGPDHPTVATDLFNLGQLDGDVGDLPEARRRLERALVIRVRALGEDHPDVAACENFLASVLIDLGDDAEARQRTEKALSIWEKRLGPSHFRVGEAVGQLGGLDLRAHRFDDARGRFERSVSILEASVGPDSPAVAKALDGLGQALRGGGALAEALGAMERALRIWEKTSAAEANIGTLAENLALLLSDLGREPEALAMHERAVATLTTSLPPEHPTLSWAIRGLALSQARSGQAAAALETAIRAESLGREFQDFVIRYLPERQALFLAAERPGALDVALGVAAGTGDGADAERVWDALVRSRARVLDEMAARRRAFPAAGDPEALRLAEAYTAASGRLANLLVKRADAPQAPGVRRALADAVAARDAAERALAERNADFRRERSGRDPGLAEVVAARPEASALIAYAAYKRRAPRPITPSYLAFVLPAGATRPIIVPLGTAAEIEPLVARWREEIMRGASSDAGAGGAGERSARRAGTALRERIWDPLARHVGEARRIFVVPDGALHVVSLAALPSGEAEYLVEHLPPIQYLSAERDLAVLRESEGRGSGLLVMGAPAYDASPRLVARASTRKTPAVPQATAVALRGPLSACEQFRAITFAPLPAAAGEAREIEKLWKGGDAVRVSEGQATESAFKALAPGRRVLHLATHGFFVGAECASALPEGTGGGDNPLRLVGLAMAGANHRREAGPDEEDGVLTAEEIASLDLSGVDWAVLSACETGRGTIQAGEGVLGLRRAFQIAGVRTVVMSLWPVDDRSTKSWMRRLYQGREQGGLESAAAVREATLGLLRERREREQGTHPLFWGAFVAAGDWR